MSDYLKGAYELVYKNSIWNKTAKAHEDFLSKKLREQSFVKEASKTALTKLSKKLSDHFIYGEDSQNAMFRNNKLDELGAFEVIAEHVSGDKMPDLMPDAKQTPEVSSEVAALLDRVEQYHPATGAPDPLAEYTQPEDTVQQEISAQTDVTQQKQEAPAQADIAQQEKPRGNFFSRLFRKMKQFFRSPFSRKSSKTKEKLKAMKKSPQSYTVKQGRPVKGINSITITASQKREEQADWQDQFKNAKEQMDNGSDSLESWNVKEITSRMLSIYQALGASEAEMLDFRLSLFAWLGEKNSWYVLDALEGSHKAGLIGNEDMSEAATAYMSIDPLPIDVLRFTFAPNGKFPHEIVYEDMLNEYRIRQETKSYKEKNESGVDIDEDEYDEEIDAEYSEAEKKKFTLYGSKDLYGEKVSADASKEDAGDLALNIYTTDLYKVMNNSIKIGKFSNFIAKFFTKGKLEYRDLDQQDEYGKEMISGEYDYHGRTRRRQNDSRDVSDVYDLTRLSARISRDTLMERAISEGKTEEESKDSRHSFKGMVYRGEKGTKKEYTGVGNKIKMPAFGSTSKAIGIAKEFYVKAGGHIGISMEKEKENKAVILSLELKGLGSGVNITDVSNEYSEKEVLLLPEAEFRVTKKPHWENRKGIYFWNVAAEEVSSPALKLREQQKNEKTTKARKIFLEKVREEKEACESLKRKKTEERRLEYEAKKKTKKGKK